MIYRLEWNQGKGWEVFFDFKHKDLALAIQQGFEYESGIACRIVEVPA